MHIFFSGIGGTGIGPLALIAKQAGYDVSGSDKQDSQYVDYLRSKDIDIHVGQDYKSIEAINNSRSIDWFVHTSALSIENPDAPELKFCQEKGIKTSKRDALINQIIEDKNLKLIAIAGTHGKTTTTAMMVWLLKQLNIPVSYSVGAKLSFGDMGQYAQGSEYFVYEADEFDRNFLAFKPYLALITGVDYDHPDIYPTREDYEQAFRDFIDKSTNVTLWQSDYDRLNLSPTGDFSILDDNDHQINNIKLIGGVNRHDAWQVIQVVSQISGKPVSEISELMDKFPGLSRRFEQIAPNIYSDYAHTPEKIRGAISTAEEVSKNNVVVVYEGLHNTRQHFIKDDLKNLFESVKKLYVVPSYLAREDEKLELLSPQDIINLTDKPEKGVAKELNDDLRDVIREHAEKGDLVLCLTAGGGGSLDEWLRQEFSE